jgi:hypothetical protein
MHVSGERPHHLDEELFDENGKPCKAFDRVIINHALRGYQGRHGIAALRATIAIQAYPADAFPQRSKGL